MLRRLAVVSFCACAALLACTPSAAPFGCIVGESDVCACPDGHTGAQVCLPDHTFDVCTCRGPSDAGTVPPLDASRSDAAPSEDAGSGILIDLDAAAGVHVAGDVVAAWDDQSGRGNDATTNSLQGPRIASAIVNGRMRPVVRFDGTNELTAAPHVPRVGTIVLVYGNADPTRDSRVLEWGNGDTGVAFVPDYAGLDIALFIARDGGTIADINAGHAVSEIECDVASWGPAGVTLERHLASGAVLRFSSAGISAVRDNGLELTLGASSGAGTVLPFTGDVAALRVYERQLTSDERATVADELFGFPAGRPDAGGP